MTAKRSMTLEVSSISARGRSLRLGRPVVDALRGGGWDVKVHVTSNMHNVSQETRENGTHYVGALGGDGYLASAATGRAGHDGVLIPFPGGRGNDLCRYLGIGTDPVAWARRLAEASDETLDEWIQPLDAMRVTGDDTDRLAFGIVSLGIDATANEVANQSWLRSGPMAYAWGALSGFFGRFQPHDLDAQLDGIPTDLGGWITSISNTGWFGGGINVVPQSDAADGILEVLNVAPVSRWQVVSPLLRALAFRHIDHPLITLQTAKEVRLEGPVGLKAHADGDVVGTLPLTVTVVPSVLRVVAPKSEPST